VDEPLAYETYADAATPGTGTARDLQADLLGSILRVVNPTTGQVEAEYSYDSFGVRSQTGTLTQRFGFTGREHDVESNLIYFRAREYDPATGRFLQNDPIEFGSGELNHYTYAANSPHNLLDPSGLSTMAVDDVAVNSAAAAATFNALGRIVSGLGNLVGRIEHALAAVRPYASTISNIANSTSNSDGEDCVAPDRPPEPYPFGWEAGSDGRIHSGNLTIKGPLGPSEIRAAIMVLEFSVRVRKLKNDSLYAITGNRAEYDNHATRIKKEEALLEEMKQRAKRNGC
jgi:RHS repeat-associated protein